MVSIAGLMLLQIPLTLFMVNVLQGEALWGEVPRILSNANLYLTVLLTVFLLMLPFMLYRRLTRLVLSVHPY